MVVGARVVEVVMGGSVVEVGLGAGVMVLCARVVVEVGERVMVVVVVVVVGARVMVVGARVMVVGASVVVVVGGPRRCHGGDNVKHDRHESNTGAAWEV